jgi:hypothetical protein
MPPRAYISPVSDDAVIAVFNPNSQLKATTVLRLLGLRRSRQRIIDAQLRRLSRPPHNRLVEIPPPAIAVHRNPYYTLAATSAPASPPPAPHSPINSKNNADGQGSINEDEPPPQPASAPLLFAPRCDHDSRSPEPQRAMQLIGDDDCNDDDDALKEIDPPPQADSSPPPHPAARPPCSVCHSVDATVVFLPCKHQLSCAPCWESAKKHQRSIHNRKKRSRMELADAGAQRARFQAHCPWCQQNVQEEIHPFVS